MQKSPGGKIKPEQGNSEDGDKTVVKKEEFQKLMRQCNDGRHHLIILMYDHKEAYQDDLTYL